MVYVSKYNNYFFLVDTIVCTKFISLYPKTMESSLRGVFRSLLSKTKRIK